MSMTLTRRGFAAAAIALATMIAAPQKTLVQDLTKLTFIQEWPVPDGFWIPWILGSKKGFYAAEGLEIEIVTPPTVADTMKFLGTGQAQVAFTTVMDVIFAVSARRAWYWRGATGSATSSIIIRPLSRAACASA